MPSLLFDAIYHVFKNEENFPEVEQKQVKSRFTQKKYRGNV